MGRAKIGRYGMRVRARVLFVATNFRRPDVSLLSKSCNVEI